MIFTPPILKRLPSFLDSFLVYYPKIRKHIAKENFDDIFYFHHFNSTITNEANIKDLLIS